MLTRPSAGLKVANCMLAEVADNREWMSVNERVVKQLEVGVEGRGGSSRALDYDHRLFHASQRRLLAEAVGQTKHELSTGRWAAQLPLLSVASALLPFTAVCPDPPLLSIASQAVKSPILSAR
ncbi:unnamed protein product [Protopolystoma xenopodis]|uniref:Uncharacterized protein n=1 Tax=Protopolystoma xenopodis TaxID=117903 RepID=A0A448WB14_9PLAT|nr:unnamed protein product [Protopolystoma xenopodis]